MEFSDAPQDSSVEKKWCACPQPVISRIVMSPGMATGAVPVEGIFSFRRSRLVHNDLFIALDAGLMHPASKKY